MATAELAGLTGLAVPHFLPESMSAIEVIVQVGNGASERVMQKLGMRLERQTTDLGSGRQVRVYTITRSEYLSGAELTPAAGY
jgi:RimJ/RimL family protein N-acetyltransferase